MEKHMPLAQLAAIRPINTIDFQTLADGMSLFLGRLAGRTGQRAFRARSTVASSEVQAKKEETQSILQRGAKRDPELYVGVQSADGRTEAERT